MATTSPTARLEARIPLDLHVLLRRAAELEGRTITDFVIQAVQQAAQTTVERTSVIRLSLADQDAFANAILNPPPYGPCLGSGLRAPAQTPGAYLIERLPNRPLRQGSPWNCSQDFLEQRPCPGFLLPGATEPGHQESCDHLFCRH